MEGTQTQGKQPYTPQALYRAVEISKGLPTYIDAVSTEIKSLAKMSPEEKKKLGLADEGGKDDVQAIWKHINSLIQRVASQYGIAYDHRMDLPWEAVQNQFKGIKDRDMLYSQLGNLAVQTGSNYVQAKRREPFESLTAYEGQTELGLGAEVTSNSKILRPLISDIKEPTDVVRVFSILEPQIDEKIRLARQAGTLDELINDIQARAGKGGNSTATAQHS